MFRTIGDQPSLWESLPEEVLRLRAELARVDALLDDPAFFAPFAPYFDPVIGRPSTPVECYLRLMFLKFRYRLGYESLCAEVSDSIPWRRFCRIPLDGKVPHPTTLMKLTTRCGPAAVQGCNEALLAKAAEAKLLRTSRLRADTTVVPANVASRPIRGCWRRRSGGSPRPGAGSRQPGVRRGPGCGIAAARPGRGRTGSRPGWGCAGHWAARRRRPQCGGSPGNSPGWRNGPPRTRTGCWLTHGARCAARRPGPRSWLRPVSGTRPRAGAGAGCTARSMTSPACWRLPGGSPPRPGSGWPGSLRPGRADRSAARHGRPADRKGPPRQARRVRLQGPGRRQGRRCRRGPHHGVRQSC